MKIGIQLYTLRTIIDQNVKEVLTKVKQMGFDGVELAGFYGLSAVELHTILNDLNLEVISTHESIERLTNHIEEVIKDYQILGTKHIVIPFTRMDDKSSYLEMLPRIKSAVKKLEDAGYQVHYHNHANEFMMFDNQFVIEHLLSDIPSLRLELDVFWATFAKIDVKSFIEKYQDRIDFIHAKDMKILDGIPKFESVGLGLINYKEIYKLKNNVWIVENDKPDNDPFENIKFSIKYIKSLEVKKWKSEF